MDDLLNEFLTETAESIDVVDIELVELEQDPNNKSVLDNIFRLVHTIKGTCGFLGLPRLESVAHAGENVLGKFRDGELTVTPDAVTLILESLDRIKEILSGLEETQEEPAGDDSEIISRLNAVASGGAAAAAPAPAAPVVVEEEPLNIPDPISSVGNVPGEATLDELEAAFQNAPGPDDDEPSQSDDSLLAKVGGEEAITVIVHLFHNRLQSDPLMKGIMDDIDVASSKKNLEEFFRNCFEKGAVVEDKVATTFAPFIAKGINEGQYVSSVGLLKNVLEEVDLSSVVTNEVVTIYEDCGQTIMEAAQKNAPVVKKKETAKAADTAKKKSAESSVANQSIRVNVQVLEDLMNMVSELVLTRNQLMQIMRKAGDSEFSLPLQRLSQCTTELQEGVMKTRMQPIGNAWAKLPRIVRDLQLELDKKIDLQMLGADTELDRQVLELIKDPLTHMVRNSADHGIEIPADRLAKGKKEMGTIRLNAFHEGGHIIIEITDDGAGIPVEKLKEKILRNELATEAEVEEMSDAQVQRYIFHAGFSTAAKVTSVSGRGVGMDVVRSNIEKIGGTVDLKSVEGKGTSFSIKIPLTLAIVSALIVKCQEERFAIPQISVLELVRASNETDHRIEYINDTPVLRLRDRLLPLVYLKKILGLQDEENEDEATISSEDFIVISQVGTFTFGIVVDQVFDAEEIVVKPMAPLLRDLSVYSGNTILGDGSVIMILDPNGIATATSDVLSDSNAFEAEEEAKEITTLDQDREAILLFKAGDETQRAVPLSLVARLEEVDVKSIETSDGKPVVQYRGQLMPLIKLNDQYHVKDEGRQPVLVFTDGEQTMGLIVDEIVDIMEDNIHIELNSGIEGQIGTAVIDGNATEVIDVAYYINIAFGGFKSSGQMAIANGTSKTHVLLIDDSSFFLNMIRPLLNAAGYKITAVDSAQDALKLRERGKDFDIIVSDIEMPEMDGFHFAEEVRSQGRWKEVPLVALSSRQRPEDFARGREVGFDDYVVKLDRETLIKTLDQQVSHGNAA